MQIGSNFSFIVVLPRFWPVVALCLKALPLEAKPPLVLDSLSVGEGFPRLLNLAHSFLHPSSICMASNWLMGSSNSWPTQ